jgi:hypothetical protein
MTEYLIAVRAAMSMTGHWAGQFVEGGIPFWR